MSTSGSVDFSVNLTTIIYDAMALLGDVGEGESVSAARSAECKRRLNMMVKAWMANGTKLFAVKQATLFLTVGQAQYSLGATGDHCTSTYVQTSLSAAAVTGATTLSLTTTTGMAASDAIGIVLDSGAVHWTTISGAPGAPTTIAAALPSDAASGNVVFTYTSKINRPQRIVNETAYWRSAATQDTPVKMLSRSGYVQLANKTTTGKIVQAYYDPQMTNGVLSVWPTPDSSSDVLRFSYERIFEDFDNANDNPDFPIEWADALIYGLADRMSPTTGVSLQERAYFKAEAAEKLGIAMAYDTETTSVFFQPEIR